ncbi:unnamed protein product [Protopolystoma xenopodis]|uniref:Uncharacterized protein n=1 Tax=Protopolystoma xenopodis TaxID=117903 RepID=A0A3S5C1Q3_9PLAT|nr:unnamed protein product [Protopolystoma xenopodis]
MVTCWLAPADASRRLPRANSPQPQPQPQPAGLLAASVECHLLVDLFALPPAASRRPSRLDGDAVTP